VDAGQAGRVGPVWAGAGGDARRPPGVAWVAGERRRGLARRRGGCGRTAAEATGRGDAMRIRGPLIALAVTLAGAASPAGAYDPATTNAGLTQRAVTASTLHQVLARRL